jgi:5-methylcytosine-specific restriction endonuclease McrA
MDEKQFAKLQRYIVRLAYDAEDAKAAVKALQNVNWDALYKQSVQAPENKNTHRLTEEERQERAKRFRAMPYQEYLKTQYWGARRTMAIKRAKERCQVCNRENVTLNVHHRTYERLGCELNSDLIVLCASCHETFHKNGKLAG